MAREAEHVEVVSCLTMGFGRSQKSSWRLESPNEISRKPWWLLVGAMYWGRVGDCRGYLGDFRSWFGKSEGIEVPEAILEVGCHLGATLGL